MTPEQDLRARWLPSTEQVAVAKAMLAAAPGAYCVIVPICQPGKVHGIWQIGQEIEHPPGYWLARTNGWEPGGTAEAHDLAEAAAERHLGDRPGTPGYALIYPDGHAAVFEGFERTHTQPPAQVVHLVMRDNLDGLYGFAVEQQADAYAARFEGADRGTLQVLDATAGARLLAEPDDTEPHDTDAAVENAAVENGAEREAAPTGRATRIVQLPARTQFRAFEDRLADMTDGSFQVTAFEVFDHPAAIVADGVTAQRHGVDPGSTLGVWFLGEPDAVRQHLAGHGWTHHQDLASRGRDQRA